MVVSKVFLQQPSKADTNLLNSNNLITVVVPRVLLLVLCIDVKYFLQAVFIFDRSFNNLLKVFIRCFNTLILQSLLG